MKSYRLLLILLFLSFTIAHAQLPKGHYMPFGIVYSFETVKDDALSPVSYSGHFGGLSIGYYFQNEKWISLLDINGSGGIQHPDVNREGSRSSTITTATRGSYQLLRKLSTYRNWTFYSGLLSHNIFDFRQHNRYGNSSDNYEALFGFGPSFAVQRPFELFNKNFAIQYTLGIPFGAYYIRPSYIKPYFGDKAGSKGFAFWGDFYTLNSKTELIWMLGNGNQLRLFYNWEFSQLDVLNKTQTEIQQIGFSTIFKF